MKVLIVQKIKGIGGSEKYFLNLLPHLQKRGIDVSFISIRKVSDGQSPIDLIRHLEKLGIQVFDITIKHVLSLRLLYSIYRIVKAGNYDIIHTHLIHADFWLALLKWTYAAKSKLISTKHGYDEDALIYHGLNPMNINKNLYYRVAHFSESRMDYSYAVSNGLAEFFVNSGISRPEKMGVIPHGFDSSTFIKEDDQKYRKSQIQVISIGRIIELKGFQFIIRSFIQLTSILPEIKLIIAGADYGFRPQLEKQISQHGLIDNIEFIGHSNNVLQYISNSDVLIVASKAEGFGLTVLEGYMCQTPVVSFDVPACNELIIHEKTGLLIDYANVEELSNAILRIINNKEFSDKLTEKAALHLKENFSISKMVDETIDTYEKVSKSGLPSLNGSN